MGRNSTILLNNVFELTEALTATVDGPPKKLIFPK